ncbi:hypothetical protein F5890DRAFT_1552561 [Lentinula detonsa]|uniref:Uncharacterized protein n=1 Tax=Lentinula detonsa TaxID=2804962 RepID=A0AA38Q3D3_9AGAR|nr:hypothetical protein F5890DRAFT_1552561 [Lentinula detonsa]
MSNRNLHSRCTRSAPAVPSAPDAPLRMGESENRSDSPLTPIESEGLSRAPSPKGQGYESALSEPEEAESIGLADKTPEHPETRGTNGGRVETPGEMLSRKSLTDEPAVTVKATVDLHKRKHSLSSEQELTIQMAEASLSEEQREQLEKRQNSVRILDDNEESRGEDAPSQKGKGVDPLNWGNVILTSDESNLNVQTQILASISETREKRRASREQQSRMQEMIAEFQTWQRQETERIKAKYQAKIEELKKVYTTIDTAEAEDLLGLQNDGTPTVEPGPMLTSPRSDYQDKKHRLPSRPSELIVTTSHVGRLFNQMKSGKGGDDEPKEEAGDDTLVELGSPKKATGMRIKPLKPTEIYDGAASLRSFQRNMREIIAYLEDVLRLCR